jgi:O-antigen ligase/polysaccharide polymerase Wzy-like membrane protein
MLAALRRGSRHAAALGLAVAGIWAWWAWKQGAYFGTVMLPGAVLLFALCSVALLFDHPAIRLRGAPALALGSLGALALLTAASAAWSSAPDVAAVDAVRVAAYAAAFFLGIAVCHLLGRDMHLSALVLVVPAAAVGIATVATLGIGDDLATYLHGDGTLYYPLGYRNATGAFFVIAVWPALSLALEPGRDSRLRAFAFAAAVMFAELAVLSQSRGAMLGAAVGATVFVAASQRRRLAIAGIAVVAAIVAASAHWLLAVFEAVGDPGELTTLHRAAAVAAIATALTFGAAFIVLRRGLPDWLEAPARPLSRRAGRTLAASAAAAVAIVAGIALLTGSVGKKVDEFTAGGYQDVPQGTRFSANVSSNRSDFWRVSIDQFESHPIAGSGGGGFRFAYLRNRDSPEAPEDPHSVEALMASELGILGLALFACFSVSLFAGAWAPRGIGPQAAALSAGALAASAAWLAQSSVDWFWSYAAVTAPVLFLAGAAAAPALLDPGASIRRGWRWGGAVALAVAAVAAMPLFASERYLDYGVRDRAADSGAAFSDFGRAADLNPFAADPLLAEGELAAELGDPARAERAFRDAIERQPENWVPHLRLGELLTGSDPATASAELRIAHELNPSDERVRDALAGVPPG